jgi:transposase
MTIVFAGIDLANNQFVLHGVHEASKTALLRPVVRRDQLLEATAKPPLRTIGVEALLCAHH